MPGSACHFDDEVLAEEDLRLGDDALVEGEVRLGGDSLEKGLSGTSARPSLLSSIAALPL